MRQSAAHCCVDRVKVGTRSTLFLLTSPVPTLGPATLSYPQKGGKDREAGVPVARKMSLGSQGSRSSPQRLHFPRSLVPELGRASVQSQQVCFLKIGWKELGAPRCGARAGQIQDSFSKSTLVQGPATSLRRTCHRYRERGCCSGWELTFLPQAHAISA